jgi:hypothetical protein
MNIIALGELLLFTFFIIKWRLQYGQLGSVSAYYYELLGIRPDGVAYVNVPRPWEKNRSGEFMACMGLTGISMWFYPSYSYYNNTALLFFVFAGLFLFLVAAAATFKDAFVAPLHYIGAIGSIVMGFCGLYAQYPENNTVLRLVIVFIVGSLILRKVSRNYTYWQELLAFYILIPSIAFSPPWM